MIAVVVELLGGWRAAVFAALFVAAGAAFGVQSLRLNSAHAELAVAKARVTSLESAAATNLAAIDTLKHANDEFARSCAVDAAKSAETISQLRARDAASAAQAWNLKIKLREAYRNDQASRDWAAQRVPDAVAVQLRAAFDRTDTDGGGEGASTDGVNRRPSGAG